MAALSRDAHRRRVLEHQAKVAADRGKPVPTPIPSSSDPQLKIRLIGEVKRTDETVEPKRGRRRSLSARAAQCRPRRFGDLWIDCSHPTPRHWN
jgi:hypothetical protein